MGAEVPIGQRENERLEFKAADSLRHPLTISREVVAMLNAHGGRIWIGLREAEGIAVDPEGVKNVKNAWVDLFNHLVEAIEPRLRPGDVHHKEIEHQGRHLLLLEVKGLAKQGPYAQLKNGGRNFVIRVDHRVRPMTREEIFDCGPSSAEEPVPLHLAKLRGEFLTADMAALWIGIEPDPSIEVDLQSTDVDELLRDPTRAGNRTEGWNYRYPSVTGVYPVPGPSSLQLGKRDVRRTTIAENGCVVFSTTMPGLHHGTDSVKEIYPLALLEYAVSIARLAAKLYEEHRGTRETPEVIFVDAVMITGQGWHLPAYAPQTYGHEFGLGTPEELEDGRFLLPSPLRFSWQQFQETPDYAGYMLVRSIYQAFHLREDRIPREYDRNARRLKFGD